VIGIGVGVAELVDLAGNITSAHTIAWRGLPVQAALSALAPAFVESDARAPALAEAMFGAGRSFKIFTYITVGTGISYCLVQDGRPYTGARGNALILSNTPFTNICSECGTILKPILEDIASGPALVTRYNQARRPDSGFQPATCGKEVVAAVEAGDPTAIAVVTTAGEALGVTVGWLVNALDPEAVIVGGGLGSAGGLYWDSFIASTRCHIWSDTNRGLPILPASLGPDAGFIGAAATVFQKQKEV
jgi:glucokinase